MSSSMSYRISNFAQDDLKQVIFFMTLNNFSTLNIQVASTPSAVGTAWGVVLAIRNTMTMQTQA